MVTTAISKTAGWLKSDYKFWMAVLSLFLGGPAVISVIQRILKIGLVPILNNALEFYRHLYYPFFETLKAYLLYFFPYLDFHRFVYWMLMSRDTYKDLSALALLSATALLRTVVNAAIKTLLKETKSEEYQAIVETYLLLVFLTLVCGFTLLGLILPVLTTFGLRGDERKINQQYLVSLGVAVIAVVAFYLTNELMKS